MIDNKDLAWLDKLFDKYPIQTDFEAELVSAIATKLEQVELEANIRLLDKVTERRKELGMWSNMGEVVEKELAELKARLSKEQR